jgi:tetratricopeptide (TPR) repeat protein
MAATGNVAGAAHLYANMLKTNPNNPDVLFAVGELAYRQNQYPIAIDFLNKALDAKLAKNIPNALLYLSTSLQLVGRVADALPILRKLVRLDRNHQEAQKSLALTYFALGMPTEAAEHFQKAIALKPNDASAHSDLGAAWFALGRVTDAVEAYRRALVLDPALDRTRYNLGSALQALGRFDEALTTYTDMIAAKPDHALAYLRYVQSKKVSEQDQALLAPLEELAHNEHPDPVNKINALFALGKMNDDLTRYDAAFDNFREANRLDRVNHKFDRQQLIDETDRHIDFFSKEFFAEHTDFGLHDDITPIFIVGMPRSGTTLIDQILSSHSQVSSAGEQHFWINRPSILPQDRKSPITREEIADTANDYLRFLRSVTASAPRMIDKLPHNFLRLGYIHLCFPNARIIHSQRDPIDTCLSMFFQRFIGTHPYACDLDDLAFAYEQYLRLMAHWKTVMPQQILDVRYEEVVADQLGQTQRMLAFCALEWEDGCVNFADNRRAVMTASNWQVRQPINNAAVARWKRYSSHIGPLARLAQTDGTTPAA